MRKLVIVTLAGLVVVGGLTFYVEKLAKEVGRVDTELAEEHAILVQALRELDRLHPAPTGTPSGAPDDARVEQALNVRKFVSKAWEELGSPARRKAMGGRVARNAMLRALREGLAAEKMGPSEYRAIVQRLSVDPVLATRYAEDVAGGIHAPEIEPELERILGVAR